MSTVVKPGGLLSSISSGISNCRSKVRSYIATEHSEVVNPDGSNVEQDETASRFKVEERESLWTQVHNYIGSDVSSLITLPVTIFEPMSMLQKMAEIMEYSYLLDKADQCEDSSMKLVYASTWAVSVYFAYARTWKPFNPILGETYEMVDKNGLTFLAEQVSHHPPMGTAHAENEHFSYDVTSKLKTKFLGNSVDVFPLGRTRVLLKKSNMVLDLVPPPTKVHNVLFGRTWVDSPGDMVMTNLTTGEKVVLYFHPCNWFGKRLGRALSFGRRKGKSQGRGRNDIDGFVYSKDGQPKMIMTGNWAKSMSYQPCNADGEPVERAQLKEIWRVADVPKGDKYQYTHFAHTINSFDSAPPTLLASDSRLRPDRYALERGDVSSAGFEKSRLEERQRAEKKLREQKRQEFVPRWFKMSGEIAPTPWGELEVYEFNGKYHKRVESSPAGHTVNVDQFRSMAFDPWQFGASGEQNVVHGSQVVPVSVEPTLLVAAS
ncbi:oxysterol-binding protein-related protein 3A [Physcomitrium patens]|uniref:Oxysterol-binding protein n=1 Tax=Physcomitrium patens TaxID=3218 RepID=A0A2K1IYL8_PHYPA|nr:oxysterol-binding protein-related protein 3A-like [Physcomitrium patens]PNR34370.1 hypothetical protein PHYPA_024187 [Physcomitrium patens]|eukprot:XP_024403561.1 oxysterol-binding protein-related protein 3A-like [Physcomitrella patens]